MISLAHNGYRISPATEPNKLRLSRNGSAREIYVPPLSRIAVRGEICPSDDPLRHFHSSKVSRWQIAPLRSRTDPTRVYPVPGAVDADSVRLYRVDAQGSERVLRRGNDYTLEPEFCGITLSEGLDPTDGAYRLDYDLRLQRVDVLAEKDGEARLFRGIEALTCPRWAVLPDGWIGFARVHLRFRDKLDETTIYPIPCASHGRTTNHRKISEDAARMPGGSDPEAPPDAENPLWTEAVDYGRHLKGSPEAFARLRRRFDERGNYSLVYFGDSITQGGDVDPELRFTARFSNYLTGIAPHKSLSFHNAAIGGTSSSYGRERFERDVLAHSPDAVTILFALNDKKLDDTTFIDNHGFFVEELRARNAEPILFTSNMNTAIWMPGLDHAEQRIVEFCRAQDLICLDAYGVWKELPRYGIPYESLLANGINHPDGVAAGVFLELLKRVFTADSKE
jgi:lysophospholipase L1-like esterase